MNHFFDEEAGAMEQEVASILTSLLLDPGLADGVRFVILFLLLLAQSVIFLVG